jgi:6-phosphogluconolactonase
VTTTVYVACAKTREIATFRLDARGTLSARSIVAVPGIDVESEISLPLAVSRSRRRLYAALRGEPYTLCSYAIDDSGDLELIGSAPLAHSMAYLSVDADDSHVLAAARENGRVITMRIDADGCVATPPTQVLDSVPNAHCILVGRLHPLVYVPTLLAGSVIGFRYDSTSGQLSRPVETMAHAGAAPRHATFGRDERTLYLVGEHDATVTVFDVDAATASLAVRQVVRTFPEGTVALAADIHLTPDERFLYISERNTNVIVTFSVDPDDGTLSLVGRSDTEGWPRSFAITSDGRFLIAAGQTTDAIAVSSIGADDGLLTHVDRVVTPGNPSWVEIVTTQPTG